MPKPLPGDTDLPGNLRYIEDDEWEKIPKHSKTGEPDVGSSVALAAQLKHEKEHGHPAKDVVVPDDD